LYVDDGTLRLATTGGGDLEAGDYAIPFQLVSCILAGPGTTVSHDALRLMARHGTGLVAVGEDGVRMYASMPFGPDDSALARKQAAAWADPPERVRLARRMYAWRLGELLPSSDIAALRGIEGARVRESYRLAADRFGIEWKGRRYDRSHPEAADLPNQAINHAASATEGAAMIAVASVGAIPQLGFIHEDSGIAFCLDIADLFRDEVTLNVAFGAVKTVKDDPGQTVDRAVRRLASQAFNKRNLISSMITRIKELFDADDGGGHP
jgi:CRISPR-associated protein Cas1